MKIWLEDIREVKKLETLEKMVGFFLIQDGVQDGRHIDSNEIKWRNRKQIYVSIWFCPQSNQSTMKTLRNLH